MPLAEFFREQLRTLEDFLGSPDGAVRRVLVDGEMRPILLKMLAGRDAEDSFPHALLGYQEAFTDPVSWFAGMQDLLEAELAEHGAALTAEGIAPPGAKDPAARGPWPFLIRAEDVADKLPDWGGALAFVVDPEQVRDPAGYLKSISFLAQRVRSPRLKFIILENRQAPALAGLDGVDRVSQQVFWASPQELEAGVTARLADAGLKTEERQRLLAMAASFAFANRDYVRAEALHREQLASPDGPPMQRALGHYGLGSTLLAAGQADEAAETFLHACSLCIDHGLYELAPMAYTNLGVALHRLGRFGEAFGALRVARNFFRNQGNRPGEAFVCDNLATMHAELGRREEAAGIWRYGLGLYEGITNPALADVREAGRADLLAKLKRVTNSV